MSISEKQLTQLRRMGIAVDEMEFRCEAARRLIEATRDAIRSLRGRVSEANADLDDWNLRRGVEAKEPGAVATALQLGNERDSAARQIEDLERQYVEAQANSDQLVAYFAPLRELFERIQARSGMSADQLGVPRGHVVPRGTRADVVIGGR